MRFKRLLIIGGFLAILIGVLLMLIPEPSEEKSLWEKIPDEEIHTNIEQKRKTTDIWKSGPVEEGKTGELEENPPAAGQVIELTLEDARLLMRVAEAEAGDQGSDGMWLVMSVVINRVRSDTWPDTIREVIYQKSQFSSVGDGRIDKLEISAAAHEALATIETGDVAEEIIGFEVKTSEVLDKYFKRAFEFKDHRFYTKR
jgi:N-acetylmuramoyl-L-alanine amidase